MLHRTLPLFAALLALTVAPGALAAEPPFPVVAVTGTAELQIAPDQALVRVGIGAFDERIDRARADVAGRTARVMAAIRAHEVAPRDFVTERLDIRRDTRARGGSSHGGYVEGFSGQRTIAITVRDLDRLEVLLEAVLDAGATDLHEVRFTHSELAEHKAQARLDAVVAARDKARAMARALGQDIGRAIRLDEGAQAGSHGVVFPTYANLVVDGGGVPMSGETLAAGQVSVRVTVSAQFELK